MQSTTQTGSSDSSGSSPLSARSFEGFLASFTSARDEPQLDAGENEPSDDIAFLSYEDALRAHTRYRPSLFDGSLAAVLENPHTCSSCGAQVTPAARAGSGSARSDVAWADDADARHATDNGKKCASITIRMSKPECDQLKRRAAEAGLTISAYLRSCTFEAEALRAEVKKTLAELRNPPAVTPAQVVSPVPARRSLFEWLVRLLPSLHFGQRVARA